MEIISHEIPIEAIVEAKINAKLPINDLSRQKRKGHLLFVPHRRPTRSAACRHMYTLMRCQEKATNKYASM